MSHWHGPVKTPEQPTPEQLRLAVLYQTLRLDLEEFEQLLGNGLPVETFSEQDAKRLDKSVTLLKMGAKTIKKYSKLRVFQA